MRKGKSKYESLTREKYIEDLKQRAQFDIVTFKSGVASSSNVMSWTNRNTGCDVISLVTTSRPFLHGSMKDLQLKLEKSHNVRPNPGDSGASVYTRALHPDSDHSKKERQLMNKILHEERDSFFRRLKAARTARSIYETTAAIVIQATVRGHLVRKNWHTIQSTCLVVNSLRLRLRRQIAANTDVLIPKLSVYRNNYTDKRYISAVTIQSAFRYFVSRRLLHRKRVEAQVSATNRSIRRIQCCGRRYNAKKRVDVIRERKLVAVRLFAVLKIQNIVRRRISIVRVKKRRYMFRWLAARMIQGFYRHVISKRKAHYNRAGMDQRRRLRGALAMQQAARAYMSKLRTGRIRERKKYLATFRAATRIETVIRRFICHRRVSRLRALKHAKRKEESLKQQEEMNRKAAEENKALLEDSDIFHQARLGNATEVDDIFTGMMSDEPHEITEVDDFGDTILLISSSLGHMEIVRKCLMWGFDINFRNEMTNLSAVSLAAQNKHFDVVQYLLNPPLPKSSKTKKSSKELKPQSIIWSPDDVAIVLTSVACSSNVTLMSTLIEVLGQGALETKHTDTGETAFHAAFRSGCAEMVKLLLKYVNDDSFKAKDEAGKTLYHCACQSSLDILNMLVESDPVMMDAIMEGSKDETLFQYLKQKEDNGKSCLLIAALYGRGDILDYSKSLVNSNSTTADIDDSDVEIGWSPSDIDAAVKTAEHGHVSCIQFLIEAGYDPSWANDETGVSILMASCKAGQLEVIDSIMLTKSSFSEVDVDGRTPIHYACMCTTDNVLSYILSHGNAKDCGVSGMSLAVKDKAGQTPLFTAAQHGCDLSVDLLAQDGIAAAINTSANNGMTPLMVSAKEGKLDTLARLVVLEADVKIVDQSGHNVLWHLLNSKADKGSATRLSISSTGLELARAGCPIISTLTRGVNEWRERKEGISSNKIKREDMEVIELLAVDKNTTFMRSLARLLEPEVCWEAVLAAIFFDGPDSVIYNALMAGGADEVLLKIKNPVYLSSGGGDSPASSSEARIMDIMYKGYTLHGWAIIGNNTGLLLKFLDKYPLSNKSLDLSGNTAFHIAASQSSPSMVETILDNSHVLVEAVNSKGRTALMEGMMSGSFKSLLKIAKVVADPRRGLTRKYDAWLLAIARKRELNEKNLQTGKIQNDDESVEPMAPDPDYLFWYKY